MLQSKASHKLCYLPDLAAHPWPVTPPPPFITKLWHFLCYILTKQGDDSLSPVWPHRSCWRPGLSVSLPLSCTLFCLLGCRKRLSHLSALKTLVHSSIMTASQSPLQLSSDPTCCHSASGRTNDYGGGRDKCWLARGVWWLSIPSVHWTIDNW